MEWLKRLFRQEEEMDITTEPTYEEVNTSTKPPFRFPLISDEEKAYVLKKSTYSKVDEYVRPKQTESHHSKTTTISQSPIKKSNPVVQQVPERRPAPKKRYVPSVVPSPVFGLKKEQETKSGIARTMKTSHQELPGTQEKVERNSVPSPTIEPSAINDLLEVKPIAMETAPEVLEVTTSDMSEEIIEVAETEEMIIEEPVMEKEVILESSVLEDSEMNRTESVIKEKIKPFNVLMLTSDKRKMEAKKEEVQPIPTTVLKTVQESTPEVPVVSETSNPIRHYTMPNSNFLHTPLHQHDDREWMEQQAERLVEALAHFQIHSEIISIVQGPAVTQFELTVGQGTKVSKIRNLTDDLKLALAAKDIRIQAPIPGRRSIGIEIPNRKSRAVQLAEVIESPAFKLAESPLEVAMGLDLSGQPVTMDLRKMPHGLIAGATGSGKSVFINSLLISLLYKASPSDLKLLLIDPKMVELAPFNHIPHLISPVITDVKAASAALKWAVEEMERRYQLFAHAAVRDISRFNQQAIKAGEYNKKLPFIVIVIDELADMMMAAPQDVEDAICRIAQKARACGIHLVLATQRPSVDVITGLIKSNVPTRIAFAVSSQIDSRTILDQQGAERLLGKGDMLYLGSGMASPIRIQGTYVSDEEIDRIIEHARSQGEPDYFFKQEDLLVRAVEVDEQDEIFEEACRFVIEHGTASTSLLQRKFHLGYNRAARLMDAMEHAGIITSQNGSKPREILVSEEFLQEIL